MTEQMELHVLVREEDGSYWAEVKELPGCFASGRDLDELKEALIEAISMCLPEATPADESHLSFLRVDEMRVLVG